MGKIAYLRPRRQPDRACTGCGERLAPWQPADHRLCRRCFGYASFRRAVAKMLESTKARP